MNSSEYWAKRARADKLKVIKRGESGINVLKKLLKINLDDIHNKIVEFYDKYGDSYAEQLSFKEFDKYKKDLRKNVKKYPKDKILKNILREDAPKYKIDRLRAFETELQTQLAFITENQQKQIKITLSDVASMSNNNIANRMKAIGVSFNTLSNKKLEQIINQSWINNTNWSEKIWKDRSWVGKKLTRVLQTGVPQGESLQKMASQLATVTHNSYNNAFRLIRTETSHIDGQVTLNGYKSAQKELNLKYYIYDAFLDARTSTICKDLDKRRFKIDDAQVGVNYPPMHPNCRSTTVIDIT